MQRCLHTRDVSAVGSRAHACGGLGRKPFSRSVLTRQAVRVQKRKQQMNNAVAALEETSVSTLDEELDKDAMYKRFDELLANFDFVYKPGDKVTGSIFRVDNRGAYVDIGAKGAAFCPASEVSLCKIDRVTNVLEPETQREFIITKQENSGELILSLKRLEVAATWQRIRQMQEEDVTVTGKVASVNRGGLLVDVENLRGFVPTSHLSQAYKVEDVADKEISLKFLEVDEERFRLVLSNKRAVSDTQMAGFKVGDVVVGIVQSVKPYGAFVDIGGVNGLLHISQISHDRISNVEQVLAEGDKLKVMVLSQDKERGRVALSTKKLEPTPGDMLRDPQLVYNRAEEMAEQFKQRVAAAEAAARAKGEELALEAL